MNVPFLSYDQLKAEAARVLSQSSYASRFPVAIELIVERDFEIEIIPIPGLQNAFNIDAFISHDLTKPGGAWVCAYLRNCSTVVPLSSRLRYNNSISDAIADLGRPDEIGEMFSGFQQYLYQVPVPISQSIQSPSRKLGA
jgi:hypothetical protein